MVFMTSGPFPERNAVTIFGYMLSNGTASKEALPVFCFAAHFSAWLFITSGWAWTVRVGHMVRVTGPPSSGFSPAPPPGLGGLHAVTTVKVTAAAATRNT